MTLPARLALRAIYTTLHENNGYGGQMLSEAPVQYVVEDLHGTIAVFTKAAEAAVLFLQLASQETP